MLDKTSEEPGSWPDCKKSETRESLTTFLFETHEGRGKSVMTGFSELESGKRYKSGFLVLRRKNQ
jgi:hypothetical protein